MPRKTLWKTFTFTDPNEYKSLASSIRGVPTRDYKVYLSGGHILEIETNLPYAELRAWFRHSGVPMRDHVTDTMPLDERVKEWEQDEPNQR